MCIHIIFDFSNYAYILIFSLYTSLFCIDTKMLLSELGSLLRQARRARNLTLQQVARQAGVHFTTLSALERGQVSDLGVRKVLRVAETLGLELVLRPTGHRYTLDDVAKERAGASVSSEYKPDRARNVLEPTRLRAEVRRPEARREGEFQVKDVSEPTASRKAARTQTHDVLRVTGAARPHAPQTRVYRPQGLLGRALRAPAEHTKSALPTNQNDHQEHKKRSRSQPDNSAVTHGKRK